MTQSGAWRVLATTLAKNPVSTFGVLCVAATGVFLAYMAVWQTNILSSPDWCNRAMKAEQLQEGSRLDAALACVGLQKTQIEALALDSHINHGGFVLMLLFLIVVVVAGARASAKLSAGGVEFNVGKEDENPKSEAAKEVAGAAITKAKEIVAEETLPPIGPRP